MTAPDAWRETPDGLSLQVRVTPRSGRVAIERIEAASDGQPHLRVRVRAVPDPGRANDAVQHLLSRALDRPASAISLAAGGASRLKVFEFRGDAAALAERLRELADGAERRPS